MHPTVSAAQRMLVHDAFVSFSPSPRRRTRVILVAPFRFVRSAVAAVMAVAPDMDLCAEAESVDAALPQIERWHPTIILIDAVTWRRAGTLFRTRVQSTEYPCRVVAMITGAGLPVANLLAEGITAVIPKPDMATSLVDVLRRAAVIKNHYTYGSRVSAGNSGELPASGTKRYDLSRLTVQERGVAELIGRGVAARAIAVRLGLSVEDVAVICKRIREKLGLATSTRLIEFCVHWARNVSLLSQNTRVRTGRASLRARISCGSPAR
jgi:DNA-binding NarL/FixJ family response regulator